MSNVKNTQANLTQHSIELVTAMINIAEDYLFDARLDDALQLLESDIVGMLVKELPIEEVLRIQIQRAKIMRFKNQLDGGSSEAALELLFEAEKTAQSLGNKSVLAEVVRLVGLVIYDRELWSSTLEKPQRYFEQALALRREVNDLQGIAESLHDVGTIYQNRVGRTDGDIERAFEYFQEAYTLADERDFAREKAYAARHLGYIYGNHKGKPEQALAYHQEFLDFNEELGFKLYLAPAHTMVGFSHFAVNDQEQALMHFESGKVIAQETGAQYPLAEALFGLGLVQEQNGNFGAADKYYESALSVARPINLRPVIQAATTRINELSKHTGQAG